MFLVALKTAIVEALRATFDSDFTDSPKPRKVSIEYAEDRQDWPFILVQVHVNTVSWTGLYPDIEVLSPGGDSVQVVREGMFDGTCDLSVYALTSEERDRIWDHLVQLFLMGRTRTPTNDFFSTIQTHDLIALTVQEGEVRPIGDSIGMGTPWDPEALTYEATLQIAFTGQFFADETTRTLLPLSTVSVEEPGIEEG